MPLRLFRSRNVAGANLVQALLVVGMFGMFFLGPCTCSGSLATTPRSGSPTTLRPWSWARCRSASPGSSTFGSGPRRPSSRRWSCRRRVAAPGAHPGRRQLRDRPDAGDDPDRARRRARLPVADDAGDVGRHGKRLGPGLGLVNTSVQVGGAIGLAVLATLSSAPKGCSPTASPRRRHSGSGVSPGVPGRRGLVVAAIAVIQLPPCARARGCGQPEIAVEPIVEPALDRGPAPRITACPLPAGAVPGGGCVETGLGVEIGCGVHRLGPRARTTE